MGLTTRAASIFAGTRTFPYRPPIWRRSHTTTSFGGYDHARQAGFVHVADHHVSPGKKLWTWGNAGFGYAWDRELTDSDGPYVELMAGVYADNQPDFSWLQPYETRTFRQYWYPIRQIGPAVNASRRLAVNLETGGGQVKLGVCAAESLPGARVILSAGTKVLFERTVNLDPVNPVVERLDLPANAQVTELLLRVVDRSGQELICYRPEDLKGGSVGQPATEPPPPGQIETNEELFLTGLHLEQYRHATLFREFSRGQLQQSGPATRQVQLPCPVKYSSPGPSSEQ